MLKKTAVTLISAYQGFIRPLIPRCCRFEPSCSEYAKQAISKYGFFRGAYKAGRRLLRCHPLGDCGYDPLI